MWCAGDFAHTIISLKKISDIFCVGFMFVWTGTAGTLAKGGIWVKEIFKTKIINDKHKGKNLKALVTDNVCRKMRHQSAIYQCKLH